ncbi:hypothetical protein QBC32DRAFT_42066 [Pseudoneurospora amorphoporcata]|uniref:Uncharacterized protein n=1 Tax=Pseudoneurospora amorphoporcata TaxID=241081 RepID=A0AAN6NQG5_9PEZI|nr:hypothetical protein QBC32DRAFT_42066 [Pseudoneurospora amorphoporcata]
MASNRPTNDMDKSLLDRLNALESTSVTFDTDTSNKLNPLNPPSTTTANDTAQVKPSFTIGSVPSVSKEDALTERLRVLRNASSSPVPSSASPGSGQPPAASPKPGPDTRAEGHGSYQSHPERWKTPVSRNSSQQPLKAEDTTTQTQTQILSSVWGLEEVDDQALDELLEGLQDDLNLQEDVPVEGEDEGDIDLDAIANNDGDGIIENDEDRVEKLLSELAPKPNNNSFADGNSDDDDSDGEAMTKETNKILGQVQDEINLNGGGPTADPFSLPSPPSGTRTPKSSPSSIKSPEFSLNLPTVPTGTLSPPPGHEPADRETITSLSARLSHLRSTPIKTDAFGLPSVPTTTLILPADSSSGFPRPPVSTKYQTKSTKNWVGRSETYTDEDVKRWCKVCLEDATIRCEGCEDGGDDDGGQEVYCVGCWRELHVGPGAGWEERGHRWFRLDTGKGKGEWSGPTTPM